MQSIEDWPKVQEHKINEKLEEQELQIQNTIQDIKNIIKIVKEKQNKDAIEQALSQIMDMSVKMSFIPTDRKQKEPAVNDSEIKEGLKTKEPGIDSALNIFGGRIFRTTKNN